MPLFSEPVLKYLFPLKIPAGSSIKARLAFIVFKISAVCFLAFFIIAYATGIISEKTLFAVPFFLAGYSLLIFILSFYIEAFFDNDFRKIKENIHSVLDGQHTLHMKNDFSTDEFAMIQDFIVNILSELEKKDFLLNYLNKTAIQTAHDSRSSLAALNTLVTFCPDICEDKKSKIIETLNSMNSSFNNLLDDIKNKHSIMSYNHEHYKK